MILTGVSIIAAACLTFCLVGYWTNRQLELEKIVLPINKLPEQFKDLNIIHVSDIHYGRLRVSHNKLLKTMTQEKPAFIFVTGDTIDRTEDVTLAGIQELLNQFAEIAPTYVIEGNHEQTSGQYEEWRKLMLESNATLIENQVLELSFRGTPFSLIGLKNQVSDLPPSQKKQLDDSSFTIMLAHHPELLADYVANFKDGPIDLILSGHAHGGQIRLPFIDGLLSPNQGFFPKYTNGQYLSDNQITHLVVSRGLGNSSFPFRINNKPHLLSLTFTQK